MCQIDVQTIDKMDMITVHGVNVIFIKSVHKTQCLPQVCFESERIHLYTQQFYLTYVSTSYPSLS